MWHSRAHEGFEVRHGGVSRLWTHPRQPRRVWAPHLTVHAAQRRVYVNINDIYGLIERMGPERRGTSACGVRGSTVVNHSEFERRILAKPKSRSAVRGTRGIVRLLVALVSREID